MDCCDLDKEDEVDGITRMWEITIVMWFKQEYRNDVFASITRTGPGIGTLNLLAKYLAYNDGRNALRPFILNRIDALPKNIIKYVLSDVIGRKHEVMVNSWRERAFVLFKSFLFPHFKIKSK